MSEINCPNCGAMFDPHEPKCPYCEYINPAGAQEKYMQKLEQHRLKLDNVDEEAADFYHTEMKKKGRRLALTIGITVAVIILGIVFFALKDRFFRPSYERSSEDEIREIAWQRENFPKLDELYEAGKYDELLDLYNGFSRETPYHDLWNWPHFPFADCLVRFSLFTDSMESYPRYVREGNASALSSVVYAAFRFYYRDYDSDTRLSESDLEFLDGLSAYATDIVHSKLNFTDEEMSELRSELYSKGYIEFSACEDIAKKYMNRFTE